MFGRVTASSLRHGYNTVRNSLVSGYGHARMFAGHLARSINTAAHVYRIMQPVLRDVAPQVEGQLTSKATGLKQDYNSLRARALAADETMTSVGAQLRR